MRISGVRGLTATLDKRTRFMQVSIRCGFLGSGDYSVSLPTEVTHVSIRCGFLGSGDSMSVWTNQKVDQFQSGADFWGPGTLTGGPDRAIQRVSIRCGFLGSGDCSPDRLAAPKEESFNPVRISGVRGHRASYSRRSNGFEVSIRCGFLGSGDPQFALTLAVREVSIRCGFLGSGDCRIPNTGRWVLCFNPVRISGVRGQAIPPSDEDIEFQSGADFWGPGTIPELEAPVELPGFNPVRISGVRGLTTFGEFQIQRSVSIRCGFLGSGDSTPVCRGAELGKRGALRQPLLGCGPVMR